MYNLGSIKFVDSYKINFSLGFQSFLWCLITHRQIHHNFVLGHGRKIIKMRQFNNIYCFWEEEIWNFNKLEYILWPNFKMELKLLNLIHWFIRKCFKCEKFRVTNGNKVRKISLVWHIIHCPRQWTYWPYYFFHQSPIRSNLMLHVTSMHI